VNKWTLQFFNNVDDTMCQGLINGFGAFSPWVTIFIILGLVIIVSIVGIIMYVSSKIGGEVQAINSNALDGMTFKLIFFGVLITAILLIFSIIVIANLCYIAP